MDGIAAVEIGNSAGYFEDTGIGAGRETEAVGDQFQHAVAGRVQFAVFLDETRRHLGVAVDFGAFVALQLQFSGMLHPFGYGSGTFRFTTIGQISVFHSRHFDVNVDPVQQRAGDAGAVTVNGNRSAGARVGRIRKVPTWTGVC